MFIAGNGAAAPHCCGSEMATVRWGRRAGFTIWVWRCAICEKFDATSCRYDGQSFWVGAMGEALVAKLDELIADAYRDDGGVA